MEQPKVSVIMPSLNVGRYIGEALKSVTSQTLKELEIFCIDAGSTDGTLDIIQEFISKDNRIHLILSDRRSYGYQMNCGIRVASGKFIGIVDTDDWIEPDMYETLYKVLENSDADYAKGTTEVFYDLREDMSYQAPHWVVPQLEGKKEVTLSPCCHPELIERDDYIWNGIYRRDFFKGIIYNETSGAAFQDSGALFQVISRAKKAIYINKVVYHYRQSNMAASSRDSKAFSHIRQEYKYIKKNLLPNVIDWEMVYYNKIFRMCRFMIWNMALSGEKWKNAETDLEIMRSWLEGARYKGWLKFDNFFTEEDYGEIQMFLADPMALYEKRIDYIYPREFHLRELYDSIIDQKVIIFGAGFYGKYVRKLIASQSDIIAFCDNDKEKQGLVQAGIRVISPDDATKKGDVYFVIANRTHNDKIRKQLVDLGVKEERIFTWAEVIEPEIIQKVTESLKKNG